MGPDRQGPERTTREPDPVEEEARARALVVEPVRRRSSDSRLTYATGIVAVLLAIAVVKPWTIGAPPPTPRPARPPTPVVATPVPTEDRSAEGLASKVCLGAGGWQVASIDTWLKQDVRVWRAIEPLAAATGPDDPSIPSSPVVAYEVQALGWCAPVYGPDRPVGPAIVTAWLVRAGAVEQLGLRQVQPRGVTQFAALYVAAGPCPPEASCPVTGLGPALRPWRTGRVVFHWQDLATDRSAWFAADVTISDALAPPTPAAS